MEEWPLVVSEQKFMARICDKDILACPICHHLINLSNKQGIYPDAWMSAIVTQISKGGDQTNVGNYRPISILPTVSKVAEKWVAKQLG